MKQDYPQKQGIDNILKIAFGYWNRTLVYQIMFSLLYFSVLFLVLFYFSNKYGIFEQYLALSEKLKEGMEAYRKGLEELVVSPNYQKLSMTVIATLVFLFPLNLGLFKIYRKLDLGEKIVAEDLFAGYNGRNFFIYTSYFLFWIMVYSYTVPTFFLAVVWVLATLFTAPLMFFMNQKILESISLNFKALRNYPVEIFVCCFVAIVFKYFGILTLFGAIFTFPFWNAIIYALYSHIFKENY